MAAIGGGAGRETEGEADRERGRSAEKALKEGAAAAASERASDERGRSQEKRRGRGRRDVEGSDDTYSATHKQSDNCGQAVDIAFKIDFNFDLW